MNVRNLAIWGVFVAVLLMLFYSVMKPTAGAQGAVDDISYSQLLQKVDSDQVKEAMIRGETVIATDAGKHQFAVVLPASSDDLLKRMEAHGVNIQARSTQPSVWMSLLG